MNCEDCGKENVLGKDSDEVEGCMECGKALCRSCFKTHICQDFSDENE